MSKKSPFKGFTIKEVEKAEAYCYVVQIGQDFYHKNGDFVFSNKEAERHYNTLLKNIIASIYKGTPKQKKAALSCLTRLKVLPLRLQ